MQSAGWLSRRKAARALRAFEWKSHPEAAEALAEALTHDDCGLVRQEAAESLARMRPCLPDVHEAVARAARCDASLLTRHWAKKALKALARGCVEDCSLCDVGSPGMEFGSGPVSDALVVPRSPAIVPGPPAWEQAPFPPGESLGPEIGEVPPLEAPALPSPFGPSDRVGPGLTAPR